MERISFAGQVAVVTGGGRGLGRGYCAELARRGASVVVNDVAEEYAEGVAAAIIADGGSAIVNRESVSSPDGACQLIDDALERFGTLDIVINNAGSMRNGHFPDQTTEMLDAMLDVHIRGSFFVSQAAWPVLREQQYGRVVMTSSAGGMFAMEGEANYAAAKAGVFGLAKALAFEGRPHGILVNTVMPHANTTITDDEPVPGFVQQFKPGVRKAFTAHRTPEAVAPLVCFLASRACTVNGETFAAGSGRFARVFVAETRGWVAPVPDDVQLEDVADNLESIRDQDGYAVPDHIMDEIELFARARGWNG